MATFNDDLDALNTGRDSKGTFVSKQKLQDIALKTIKKQQKATETARKTIDRLSKSTGKQAAIVKKLIKQQSKQIKQQSKQSRANDKQTKLAIKNMMKMSKVAQKSAEKQIRAYQKVAKQKIKTMKAGMKASAPAGGGRGGFGLGFLGGFLSAAAIGAATKALSSYVQQLGRMRGHIQALYGGADRDINEALGLRKRDQKFLGGLAQQSPMMRLLSEKQLDSVLKIREKLRQSLETEIGDALSGKLIGPMETFSQLRRFADEAGTSIEGALSHCKDFDPASFQTALDAIKMKQTDLNKTANVLETAWIQIKSSFEDFAVSVLEKHGGDIRKVISAIATSVVENMNKFRQWFAEQKSQYSWLIDTIAVVVKALHALTSAAGFAFDKITKTFKYAWETGLGGKLGLGGVVGERNKAIQVYDERIMTLLKEQRGARERGQTELFEAIGREIKQLSEARKKLHHANLDLFAADKEQKRVVEKFQVPDISQYISSHEELTQVTRDGAKALGEMSDKLRQSGPLWDKYVREQMNRYIDLQRGQIDLAKSRMRMMTTTPLGQLGGMQQRFQVVKQIDRQRNLIEQQMRNLQSMDNKTMEQQKELIQLEIERNNLVSERNQLLQDQTKGYLSAIHGMPLGAGRFSRIIITQEQNTAKALEKGLAAKTKLLGAVGKDAAREQIMPFRFGTDMAKNIQNARDYAAQIREAFKHELSGAPVISLPPEVQNLIQSGLKVDAPPSIPLDAPESIRLELPDEMKKPSMPTIPKIPSMNAPKIPSIQPPKISPPTIPTIPKPVLPKVEAQLVERPQSKPKTKPSAPILAGGVSGKLDRAGDLIKEVAGELRDDERRIGSTPLAYQSSLPGQP